MKKDYHDSASTLPTKINYILFNQDQSCFACATTNGFRIYNSCPYDSTFCRDLGGSIRIVEMLFKTNILALVGSESNALFPPNKVIIWDDRELKCVGEICFKHPVLGVRLRKDVIVAVVENKVYAYKFEDFKLLSTVSTFSNPKGLCSISYEEDGSFLVVPGKESPGTIQIVNNAENTIIEKKAHISELATIALSKDSKYCATASVKGTLIRIFSTADGKLLQELRRGAGNASIESIVFDKTSSCIACSSNKKTIHIFSLLNSMDETTKEEEEVKSTKPTFGFMQGIVSYFKSECSVVRFRVTEGGSILSFGPEGSNTIIGISSGKVNMKQQ
eukprot:TRINITY_DN136027_c0_g1_i1.p1 TRINITY_DN136027_c0_g1~~TRINITY_DN136027_c0_g1_i1.p1  ORF type:complete len:371 (+),score=9.28 TRINITY_DN136027_c0_g1_i1:119-1114(+)